MGKWVLLFLIPWTIYGASYEPRILSLDNEYPIEMNNKNRENLAKDQQNVEQILNSKRFHWEYVVGPILFALLFLIARHQPEKAIDKEDILRKRRVISKNKAKISLKGLNQENLPQQQRFNDYYNRITFIVREYIEEYYSIHAPEETTEEFLRDISLRPIFDKNTEAALAEFLKSADRVKFSDHTPTIQECTKAQQTAEEFIS